MSLASRFYQCPRLASAFAHRYNSPRLAYFNLSRSVLARRCYSEHQHHSDPRLADLGRQIQDEYAQIREYYATPKHPIVLAHGLLGFAELRVAGRWLPAVQYWRGISDALAANGVEVITTTVPPSGSIEQRAEKLGEEIARVAQGKSVNIVAHSMGGLDARHMISHLRPKDVNVVSLVTVASPHHGSAFADYLIEEIGPDRLPSLFKFVHGLGMETGAFSQLTQKYMSNDFNPKTPNDPDVRYFSYGAMMGRPPILSPFRLSHTVLNDLEGPNDGLVSVKSSKWGDYKGTLVQVSHMDLINWTNRLRWTFRRMVGKDPTFNAIAFYLDIADMLAKEGL
ncbi:Alpha/Beta hydrolase protein [Pseudomassariella vexata]|uniref:Alpha/Beta hydrolase protein n=1 Tax=Pseudomassariella vexata TaxID=1141098 RepID=A0A1Y2DUQ3_9PEZI|nr:Alpha/Beta hydrolase protein [Pseudomassariella vexata]ORY62991.1 Alpha/Beta hydrolase protein [Pseudomassariella vexata]